ncbi:hypothetical protein [Shouchella patagoniensis]|uniref:hypothetical protein n=1 Tax=Shouchella patagoniensis TaxID=228576 RepID=UPI001FE3B9FB|nr:hypothetical protein [Shouchella patagoniensis]
MQINDTVPYFLNHYQPTISFLRNYYENYPETFKSYFPLHCKDTKERLQQSLDKYPHAFQTITEVHALIPSIIKETAEHYRTRYMIDYPGTIHLLVGGFGSNSYTHRQIIPDISFALERLLPNRQSLRVIVAHEFGHATQNILSDQAGMKWEKKEWTNPLIWLNQEGAATHFSRQIAPELPRSIYFTYSTEGDDDWLEFAIASEQVIKRAFASDYDNETTAFLLREWFSVNGGTHFGYSRLGYFLGDRFFQQQIERFGEKEAIIAWRKPSFLDDVSKWIRQGSFTSLT